MNSVIYSQMLQENKKRRRENEKANEVKRIFGKLNDSAVFVEAIREPIEKANEVKKC